MKKIYIFIVIFFVSLSLSISKEIKYKVSGKVVYKGEGINNVIVSYYNVDNYKNTKAKVITDKLGNFYFYAANGIYKLSISNTRDFVSKNSEKIITVNEKNITNVTFFLEKECEISGEVKFNNGDLIKGSFVIVSNKFGSSESQVNIDGKYLIKGIVGSEKTDVILYMPGIRFQKIEGFNLSEGEHLTNINFNISKEISIKGKIIDKDSKELLNHVYIVIGDGKDQFSTFTDDKGEFEVYNLDSGKYGIICAESLFYKDKYIEIFFEKGKIKNITVEMEKLTDTELKKKFPKIDINKFKRLKKND